MAIAILAALVHRERTGEGQWVDLSCTEAGLGLNAAAILDYTVNGRPSRRPGQPHSNRSEWPPMAPHGIYPSEGEDAWIAIACRDERDWRAFAALSGEAWGADPRFATLAGRLAHQDEVDRAVAEWTRARERFATAAALQAVGVPAAAVQRPAERIDADPNTRAWGLWPTVEHTKMGRVRVDGLPVHFSRTDWRIERGAPCVGEHTDLVLRELLGLGDAELAALRAEGVT
jgi:crotonobetainyl-CoA:carnitine CoA-transferase CaiB-like acyl-CoA transferase